MARGQKRMIHTNIWQNETFASMSETSQLLYIGLITLADDDGKLKGNSLLLKSQVFPFHPSMTLDSFKNHLKEVVKCKFIDVYRVKNEYFIAHPNWEKFQIIRKDLYKPSNLPDNPLRKRNVSVTEKYHKLIKDKLIKDKESAHAQYLSNIPNEDLKEFYERFDCSEKAIKDKAESLKLWCESNGKQKKNYKAFLLVALKKDFPERKEKPKAKVRYEVINGKAVEIIN